MKKLQKVGLRCVKMSAWRWAKFASSLISVQHIVHITLERTDIDGGTVNTIHSSPHFNVTKEERNSFLKILRSLEFHTVK